MTTNNPEEPPLYLSIGTEVSAKFKGAFCEAKIKRIDKTVKCNLKLKHNSELLTVLDTAVRSANGNFLPINEFKPGSIVYVSKQNPSDSTTPIIQPENLNAATLNKLLDQSVYTVVFNDGDEKTMKRSFIRFKGEKHFLDSETLNNAPLNNPEHFLYPIKGGIQGSELKGQSLTDNESDAESLSTIKKSLSNRRESNYSSITEDVTVKSEAIEHDNENGNDSDDSDCSTSSDDIPAEEKDRFVAQLFKFMDDRATPMNKVPAINKVDLDLHKFFITVKTFGGYNRVSKQRSWLEVYKKLGLPNVNSSNVINLKSAYKRYLHAFEDFYRKLGSAAGMCDLRTSSSANTSKRSTNADSHHRQLFKSRYLTPTVTASSAQKKNLSNTTASSKSKTKKTKNNEISSETSSKPSLTSESISTPVQPKRTPSMDDLNQNTELTIESIANSNLFSSSIVSSGGSMIEDHQQQSEELTLFSIAKTFTEDSKKAKKQEKEKKEKQQLSSNEGEKSGALKRLNPASQQTLVAGKLKMRRSSTGKTNEDDDSDEDDDEPKEKKKKTSRLSLNEDTISSSKRKNSLKSQNLSDNSDNEKDTNSLDGTTSGRSTNGGNESSIHDVNTDMETNEKKCKMNINIKNLDVNDQVKVKYGTSALKSIYPAKIMQINLDNNTVYVHYDGWNKRYDEWIKLDRIVSVIADKNKKAKTNSSASKNSTTSTTSKNSTNNEKMSNSNSDVSSPSNSNKNFSSNEKKSVKTDVKDPSEDTEECLLKSNNNNNNDNQLNSQIVKKRSSTTSSSSSVSSNSNTTSHENSAIIKDLNESAASTKAILNSKQIETTTDLTEKLTTAKLTLKTRNSDSISSNCSTYSIKRPSIDDLTLISGSIKENDVVLDQKAEEIKIEAEPVVPQTEPKIEPMNALLSIKEEIMDFEPSNNIAITVNVISNSSPNTIAQDQVETKNDEIIKTDECESTAPRTPTNSTKSSKVTLKRNSAKNTTKKDEITVVTPSSVVSTEEIVSKNEASSRNLSKKLNEEKQAEPISTTNEKKIETTRKSNEKPSDTLVKQDVQSTNNETRKVEETSKKSVEISSLDQENLNLPTKKTSESKVFTELTNEANTNLQTSTNEENVLTISKKTENVPVNTTPEAKYSFNLIGVNLTGKQKIRYIEEQMKLCREAYAKLKNEIAVIDRKKKKLKRSLCDKSTTNAVTSVNTNGNNNNNNNNADEI